MYHIHVSTVVQCPTLTAPDNGMIFCTGNEIGDTCTVSCDDGYESSGSETRTCQGDGTWSGTDATCSAGMCNIQYRQCPLIIRILKYCQYFLIIQAYSRRKFMLTLYFNVALSVF